MALLMDRKAKIADLIPPNQKENADYFIARALFTFQRKENLHGCTLASFVQCVLEGAELGLPVDGKLGYAVPFNCNVAARGEPPRWEKRAQFIPGYLGLVVVGKRTGQILDADADLVCEKDTFRLWRDSDGQHVEYVPALENRGRIIGAFCSIRLPSGDWKYEYMEFSELEAIRNRSKAKDDGPWKTDTNEMYKKTVVRRGMKMETNDPLYDRMISLDDRQFEEGDEDATPKMPAPRSLDELTDKLTGAATPRTGLPAPQEPEIDIPGEIVEADQREPEPVKRTKGKQQRQETPEPERADQDVAPAAASSPDEPGEGSRPPEGWVERTRMFIAGSEDFQAARNAYDEACGPNRKYELSEDEHAIITDAWNLRSQVEQKRQARDGKAKGQGRLV